jgi:hypothetical protein
MLSYMRGLLSFENLYAESRDLISKLNEGQSNEEGFQHDDTDINQPEY